MTFLDRTHIFIWTFISILMQDNFELLPYKFMGQNKGIRLILYLYLIFY